MNYLDEIAEQIRAAVPLRALPDDDTEMLFRIYAVLLLAKGRDVSASDVHNAWTAWMAGRDPEHESLVPFADLSAEVTGEDAPFVAAIKTVANLPIAGRSGRAR